MDILTFHGIGLMAQLIATVMLIATLTGFMIKRSQPWLVGVVVAMVILAIAVTLVVEATT
jgi:hypothetical protein